MFFQNFTKSLVTWLASRKPLYQRKYTNYIANLQWKNISISNNFVIEVYGQKCVYMQFIFKKR